MVDPKNSGKCPRVRSLLLRIVDEDVSFIKGDVDDVLIPLKIVCGEVDSHNQVFVEDSVLDDDILITVLIVQRVGFKQACVEMLFEVGKEVLSGSVSASEQLFTPCKKIQHLRSWVV